MFVRRKRESYYLVENRREGGKVRQRVVAYLGPAGTEPSCETVEGAIAWLEKKAIPWYQKRIETLERWLRTGQYDNLAEDGVTLRPRLNAYGNPIRLDGVGSREQRLLAASKRELARLRARMEKLRGLVVPTTKATHGHPDGHHVRDAEFEV